MEFSLCMIVKNEEAVLKRCLESTRDLFDEIIIVDTGSSDQTKEVASAFTSQIYDFKWIDDFSAARNESFSKASKDFIMWLDADDVIMEEDYQKLKQLKKELTLDTQFVMMKYHVAFDENNQPIMTYYRERLIQNHQGYRWQGMIHEAIVLSDNILYSDIAICHKKEKSNDSERNLRIFEMMKQKQISFSPRDQFYYARELYYHYRYKEALEVFEQFLKQDEGWVENKIEACLHMSYCYFAMHEFHQALNQLFHSFCYDVPRAEILCEIGRIFMCLEQYEKAVYWYERAFVCIPNVESGAFVNLDCYGFLPCIQLCVCYDRMHCLEKAIYYNERAALYRKNHPSVLANRNYFRNMQG